MGRAAWAVLILGALLAGLPPAPAAELATEPMLRIEAPEHGAVVLGVAVAPDGTRLASASNDRTVRVWSLPELDPLRTYHLPIGPGIEGAAYTVAFSPDGKFIVTTGWTGGGNGPDGPWCFYVIEVERGDLARTVCDLPRRANHVAFSPDGRHLAFALKIGGGLRVYRTADWSVAAEDKAYDDAGLVVAFDGAGRLATAAYDGKVRLYDRDFKLQASRAMPDGRKVDSVAFSPDGTLIAVGYADPGAGDPNWPARIDVVSASDLQTVVQPDMRGVANGALARVAWSPDGRFLYAGGSWERGGRFGVRRWADAGKGRPTDLVVAPSQIFQLAGLPGGGLALSTELPWLGVLGADGRLAAERRAPLADYTDIGDMLKVSADGMTVQFALERGGANPAYVALGRAILEAGEAPADPQLTGAVHDDPDLDVRDWSNSARPTLNGQPLTLSPHERALALTIVPDAKSVVLATNWRLNRYDRTGKVLWITQVPYNARGVVVTADGRLAVAAIGDGTLRWYAMDTGKELLAFYPHPDTRRWVAWTPSGYYMASVGGDELIGWQVNRGRDHVADFFSVGRFSDKYYRPDIVQRVLATLSEGEAIRLADADGGRGEQRRSVTQLLPPVIEILEPPASIKGAELTLKYRVRTPSGEPIDEIQVRSEGHQLGVYDPPILDNHGEATAELQLIVPQRDSELLVFARNRFAASEPARVKLRWAGERTVAAQTQRKLAVLAIGVSEYQAKALRLGFAAKDAGDFVDALKRQQGKAFSAVESRILTDKDATLAGVRDGLAWLGRAVGRDDIGVVFLAGHGVDDRGTYHYLPHEAELQRLGETALPYGDLLAGLKAVAGHVVLFLDTCHAGDVLGRPGKASMDVIGLVSRLSQPSNGVVVYASSTGDQYSIETAIWRNGAFTKAVVEGLDGAAEYRQRQYITTSMLETYVKERVKDLTANRQTPTVNMPLAVPDLMLARIGTK